MGEYERYRRRRLFGDLFFKPGNWRLMFSHVCDGQVEIIQNESKERMVYHETKYQKQLSDWSLLLCCLLTQIDGYAEIAWGEEIASFLYSFPRKRKENDMAYRTKIADYEQPAYESKYQGQMDTALSNVTNRKQFEYDPLKDANYQAMAKVYQKQGEQAAKNTLGDAAALNGGYGSSYAVTASQQARNDYKSAQLRFADTGASGGSIQQVSE